MRIYYMVSIYCLRLINGLERIPFGPQRALDDVNQVSTDPALGVMLQDPKEELQCESNYFWQWHFVR